MGDKIINTFQQRRQLAQDVADLAQTTSEHELLEAVRRMARSYPGDLLTSELLKHLDTPSSQLRGGLGHLAALLPPDEIGPLLRSIAANRSQSPQTRITAVLIMERYLGETLPSALIGDLSQNNEVAFQSLREAVDESRANRHILLEYVTQMRQAGEPVAYLIMDLLDRLPAPERVDLYRLMALDDRPGVAHAAQQRLEKLAAEQTPDAPAALYSLQSILPPQEAAQIERALRKLAFSGNRYTPPSPQGWRALLSPADVGGNQSIWFIRTPTSGQADGVLMGIVINARVGILQAFAGDAMRREQLPSAHRVGELVPVRTDHGGAATLLEAPVDFCRLRLQAAQTAHWQVEPRQALPGDYLLYQDLLGSLAPPQPEPALAVYFEKTDAAQPLPPWEEQDAAAHALLAHPAMSGWILHNRLFLQGFAPTIAQGAISAADLAAHIVRELAQRPEGSQIVNTLAEGLRSQAAWLHIAGSRENARHALLLANALPHLPMTENAFLARLVESSLHAAGLRR